MPAAFEPAVTTRSIDRRRLLGGSAAGLLFATLPGIQVVDGSGSSGAGSRDVARQADPAGATLAERWVVPDDLPELPDVTAAALFVGAIDSGRVLFARDPEVQRAPASTAKIAVALTVLDVMTDLDEVVTIDVEDEVNWGIYSNAQLRAEDEVTVRDLLYGLLVPSGSDASRALARSAGLTLDPDGDDPTATFLDAVNAKSASLGTTSTMILHPAGEDIDGQITTARDIAILAAALLDNDVLAEIVSRRSTGWTLPGRTSVSSSCPTPTHCWAKRASSASRPGPRRRRAPAS